MEEATILDILRSLFQVIKWRLRYFFTLGKKIFWMDEPSFYWGLTDHPLDRWGGPIMDIFTAAKKYFGKRATSILQVEFTGREGNSFMFRAKGYNVYRIRDERMTAGGHKYIVKKKTPFRECALQIDIIQSGVYRLRLSEGRTVPEHRTEMVYGDIQADAEVDFTENEAGYEIRTADMSLLIYKDEFRMEIRDEKGALITESGGKTRNEWPTSMDAWPLGFVLDRKTGRTYGVESFVLYPGEAVYGLGEKFSTFNKVGQSIGLWNCDSIGNTAGRSYKHIPFFISTRGYGVFINESKPMTFWVGTREVCKNIVAIEGGLIDYYLFKGNPKEVLGKYTDLTGKPAVPPKWSFGTWISRLSYGSQDEVMGAARKLREMGFPSDVIHIDTKWFDEEWKCDWRFNAERYPDPAGMFSELREMGFRVSLWQTPYVIDSLEVKEEAERHNALAENRGPFYFLTFPSHVIDFSRREAVEWYQEKLRGLFELGASAIKVDFGEAIERHQRFEGYSGTEMHNLFPLLYARAAFEITREATGEGIIWARSAYAGSQRYPVHWSGDNSSNFDNLLCSLRGGLSLGMCGFTFWAQDCGGFIGTPSDKLYIRWTQLSIFNSHIRYHGTGPRFREPWNFEPDTQDLVRELLAFRYRLIPYIYSEARYAAGKGLPLLCPLVLEFWDDPNVYNIEDQYLFGRNIMVAPILTEEDTRKIYIPAGTWYDFWSMRPYEGPRWITYSCDLDKIPLFMRAGSILPLGPPMQYVGEKEISDELSLIVFPDQDGSARYMVEDDETAIEIEAEMKSGTLDVSFEDGVSP